MIMKTSPLILSRERSAGGRKLLSAINILLWASPAFAIENHGINDAWHFQASAVANAAVPEATNPNAEVVNLPHSWGWEEAQITNKYFRGPAWYFRELPIRPETDKRYFLRFEAASVVADVFLNDQKLGQHRGGFSAFCFEITTNLAAMGTNRLAVRVDNSPQPDIAPLSGDFCMFGGLYRPAHLLVTDQISTEPTGRMNLCFTSPAAVTPSGPTT